MIGRRSAQACSRLRTVVSDCWALAVRLWDLLVGLRPGRGRSDTCVSCVVRAGALLRVPVHSPRVGTSPRYPSGDGFAW